MVSRTVSELLVDNSNAGRDSARAAPRRSVGLAARPRTDTAPSTRGAASGQVLQRKVVSNRGQEAEAALAGRASWAVDAAAVGLKGGGAPLPLPVRAKMEAALGADFSGVRVRTGPEAGRVGAIAFATGNDLYFAPGQYQPGSVQGQQLIGHELAHVLQQRQGRASIAGHGAGVLHDQGLEAEADRLGAQAASLADPTRGGPRKAASDGGAGDRLSTDRPIQRKVAINKERAYDGNEVIVSFSYNRAGNPGGGNHFFPDKGVSEIVSDIARNQTRTNAYANLMILANGLQMGGFVALNNPASNVVYDHYIDQFITYISNAPKNKFDTENRTGDGGGTLLDQPGTASAFNKVKTFGHAFLTNIDAAYQHKGVAAAGTAAYYVNMLRNFCAHNP